MDLNSLIKLYDFSDRYECIRLLGVCKNVFTKEHSHRYSGELFRFVRRFPIFTDTELAEMLVSYYTQDHIDKISKEDVDEAIWMEVVKLSQQSARCLAVYDMCFKSDIMDEEMRKKVLNNILSIKKKALEDKQKFYKDHPFAEYPKR